MELDENNREAILLNIRIKFLREEYESCIEFATDFLDENPNNMECLQLRADSYVRVDELQKALLDYTKMITLNPGNEDIYLKRINLYIKMKSYSEALSDIDFLLNSDDTNALIYFYKGIINRNRGEIIDALKNYDIALKILTADKILNLDEEILETKRYFYSEKKKTIPKVFGKKSPSKSQSENKIKEENDTEEKDAIQEQKLDVETKNTTSVETQTIDLSMSQEQNVAVNNETEKILDEVLSKKKEEQNIVTEIETKSEKNEEQNISAELESKSGKEEQSTENIFIQNETISSNMVSGNTANSDNTIIQTANENIESNQSIKDIQVENKKETAPLSMEQLNKLIKEDKKNSAYYHQRADLLFAKSNFKDAVKDYDLAIKYSELLNPEMYKSKAKAFVELEKYKDAIETISKLIKNGFADAKLYYERALLYQSLKDSANYFEDINSALECDPCFDEAYLSRINYYIKQSNFAEAYNDMKQVSDFELKTDNKYLLAKICFQLKKYSEVILLLTSIYEAKKQEKETDYYLGISFAETGDYDNALKYLTNALENGFKNKNLFYSLAKTYFNKKNFKTALDFLNKSISIDSSNYEYYWLRARIYYELNNIKLSLQDYDKAIKIDFKNKDLLLEKIKVLENGNNTDDMISCYSKIIQMDAKNGDVFYKRGLLYKKIGKDKEAEKDFAQARNLGINIAEDQINKNINSNKNKVADTIVKETVVDIQKKQPISNQLKSEVIKEKIEEKPLTKDHIDNKIQEIKQMNNAEMKKEGTINVSASMIHLNRGNISFRKQNYENAISELNKAIEFNYKDPQCYLLRAEVYSEMKKFDFAIKDLLMVIDISPKATFAYSKIADIYKLSNNIEQAKIFYSKAIELNPKYANAYFGLAEIYEKSNQTDLAIEKYKEAAKLDVKLAKECNMKIAELNS